MGCSQRLSSSGVKELPPDEENLWIECCAFLTQFVVHAVNMYKAITYMSAQTHIWHANSYDSTNPLLPSGNRLGHSSFSLTPICFPAFPLPPSSSVCSIPVYFSIPSSSVCSGLGIKWMKLKQFLWIAALNLSYGSRWATCSYSNNFLV